MLASRELIISHLFLQTFLSPFCSAFREKAISGQYLCRKGKKYERGWEIHLSPSSPSEDNFCWHFHLSLSFVSKKYFLANCHFPYCLKSRTELNPMSYFPLFVHISWTHWFSNSKVYANNILNILHIRNRRQNYQNNPKKKESYESGNCSISHGMCWQLYLL